MARAYFHVVYTEGVWKIAADQKHSGPYRSWGQAVAAGIETGHKSVRRRDLMTRTQAIEISDNASDP
jgi:hypothetical protein